jgi:thiamine biosynthesis lipoprotein
MIKASEFSAGTTHSLALQPKEWGYLGCFRAMASPCELLIASHDQQIAQQMLSLAHDQAKRIEQKYSRFIPNNLLWKINHAQGKSWQIDNETKSLLDFSNQCYQLSDGAFDISAGPLMQLWRFEGQNLLPPQAQIDAAKALVDFSKVNWDETQIELPKGMSLDFGGIGKEYAVDHVAQQLARQWPDISVLVNFGGDIACPVAKKITPWQVGIENPLQLDSAAALLSIHQGALATSGNTRRFIEVNGQRYGHIIDPRSGYPVIQAPLSVTVLGPNCITAGMLATMAMLQGEHAEAFLQQQEVSFKVFRPPALEAKT